jgi:hypothetical protein
MHIGYWWESEKDRDHKEDQDVCGWITLKLILERKDEVVWIGLTWLRIRNKEIYFRGPLNGV